MTAQLDEVEDWRQLPLERKRVLIEELRRRRAAAVRKRWPTAGAFAQELDPSTRNPAHLRKIDEALVDVADGQCERLMILMPPQEGKSERTSHYGVGWMLQLNPELRIAIASYEAETARRWGQVIRNDLLTFDLPLELQEDSRAAGRWNIRGHRGGVYCVGIGGALTGRPVDVLVIDDPVKDREQADSEAYRKKAWDWWTDVARTRLAPGGIVILVMTRWHEDDLGGRILKSPGASEWRVLRIPAQADSSDDLIGREVGEYLPSAREWPPGRWEKVRRDIGSRSWNALYQGKPAPTEGSVWLRQWWRRYPSPLWVDQPDGSRLVPPLTDAQGQTLPFEVIQSWDMAFKDTKTSDYVVGQVWLHVHGKAYLLDQIRDRMDFPTTLAKFKLLTARWPQARLKLVEDKANGPAVISTLKSTIFGIVAVEPDGGKLARANATAPPIEAGDVWVPATDVATFGDELVEEAAGFPNGTHDDQVDAASQALNRIFLGRGARIIA